MFPSGATAPKCCGKDMRVDRANSNKDSRAWVCKACGKRAVESAVKDYPWPL